MSILPLLLSACAPSLIDELPQGTSGDQELILGWIEHPPGEALIEIAVTPEGGETLLWRQSVGPEGRIVGGVAFNEAVSVEVRTPASWPWADPAPLGAPLALSERGEGISELGPARLYWQVGKDLPPLNSAVDARPGPPDGWLEPVAEGAAPLVVGMSEAEAEQGWKIDGRTLSGPEKVTRGLGGMTRAEGGGIRARGLVSAENHEITSITFLFSKGECDKALADLGTLYGPPGSESKITGPSWFGGRYQVHVQEGGGSCSVSFSQRAYGQKEAPKPAQASAPAAPNAAVDANPGPPDGWLTPAVEGAPPLSIGQSQESALRDWKIQQRGSYYTLRDIPLAPGASGNVSFKEDAVKEILILWPDPACAATRAALEERYGPMSSESTHFGAEWKGEKARARATDSGEKSCLAHWQKI